MSDVSRFRSAINGFNRTDVVNYVESISVEHQKQLRQLQNELAQLRAENGTLSAEKDALTEKVGELEAALDKCRNQEPKIVKDTIDNTKKTLESVITFRQGRTTVDNSQLPNVERIATYLKNHKGASVLIKGYASPEGSVEVNERIARQRAEAVKKCWWASMELQKNGL